MAEGTERNEWSLDIFRKSNRLVGREEGKGRGEGKGEETWEIDKEES